MAITICIEAMPTSELQIASTNDVIFGFKNSKYDISVHLPRFLLWDEDGPCLPEWQRTECTRECASLDFYQRQFIQ